MHEFVLPDWQSDNCSISLSVWQPASGWQGRTIQKEPVVVQTIWSQILRF